MDHQRTSDVIYILVVDEYFVLGLIILFLI